MKMNNLRDKLSIAMKKQAFLKVTFSLTAGMLSALISTASSAEKTFSGPLSVAEFHPLCLPLLRDWQADGGALNMQQCALKYKKIEISKTAEGAFFSKKADSKNGYIAYKPIGTLDNAIELLLVFNKAEANPISSIYFLGRIPGAKLTRDFLTTIEDGGDRCLGGVRDARLVSESELEVDVNATVNHILTFLDDEQSNNTANISFNANSYQSFACAGTITKTYNLVSNDMQYSKVSFAHDESRKVVDKGSRCFEKYVAENIPVPRVLDMGQYQEFLQDYQLHCKI